MTPKRGELVDDELTGGGLTGDELMDDGLLTVRQE
jgi:hypothetical protein